MHRSIDRLKTPGSVNLAKISGLERTVVPIESGEIHRRVEQICPEVCDPECENYGCKKLRGVEV